MCSNIRRLLPRLHHEIFKPSTRSFHDEFSSKVPLQEASKQKHENQVVPNARSIAAKYQIFKDTDAPIILDVDEERTLHEAGLQQPQKIQDLPDMYSDIDLTRGKTGVYEINELVTVLRLQSAINIFVCSVPKEIKYVDYMCIVSGRSVRHMRGIAEFVRKVYKMKRLPTDIIPKIEGETSSDWMALDLGNIALHIFSAKAREQYDLESLWSVGSEFDREYNKPSGEIVQLYEKYTVYLNDLKPVKKESVTVQPSA
ncbi:mitochondrial assembly of ribosomal large subunit protein 1 [Anopheles nili]|uniref:mitochondrial assembly of ribosomal large subunit protein 1 n=1 Tax=Anopheles nili TaxID=185578 RepID=UPI00237A3D8F|nr:mitochondrial assembly of ribosomal large subunit protein 1 [Anopheles nili]